MFKNMWAPRSTRSRTPIDRGGSYKVRYFGNRIESKQIIFYIYRERIIIISPRELPSLQGQCTATKCFTQNIDNETRLFENRLRAPLYLPVSRKTNLVCKKLDFSSLPQPTTDHSDTIGNWLFSFIYDCVYAPQPFVASYNIRGASISDF